jgi:hypothetical protein
MTFNERDWDLIDGAVERAATRIDEELEKLVQVLPPNVTAPMALGLLARRLNEMHPVLLKWLDPANAPIRPRPNLKVINGGQDGDRKPTS